MKYENSRKVYSSNRFEKIFKSKPPDVNGQLKSVWAGNVDQNNKKIQQQRWSQNSW